MDDLRRRILMLVVAAALALGALPPSAATAAAPGLPAASVVGVFVPRIVNGTGPYTPDQVLAEADALGVDTIRVGREVSEDPNGQVRAFDAEGKRLVLGVKGLDGSNVPPSTPSELSAYRDDLDHLLDQVDPALLVVENEETVERFVAGTPHQYVTELEAAVDVGHAHGLPVTNGGLPFEIITLVVWNHLRTTQSTEVADRFLGTVSDTSTHGLSRNADQLEGTPEDATDPYSRISLASRREAWKDAEHLLDHDGSTRATSTSTSSTSTGTPPTRRGSAPPAPTPTPTPCVRPWPPCGR